MRKPMRIVIGVCLTVSLTTIILFQTWVTSTQLPPLTLDTSQTVVDHKGELLRAYTVSDGRWRLPVDLIDVDHHYLRYLIRFEDKRFYSHPGVDVLAIIRAAGQALLNGRIVSGASTLTMQVARLLEQGNSGRWEGKIRQLRVALALENVLTKTEILSLYLKLAPFGGNLEGVRAASLAYFGKEPKRLTPAQAALLVSLPQSPENRRPDRAAEIAFTIRNRVLNRLAKQGLLSTNEALAAMTEKIPNKRRPFPVIAPHLSDRKILENPLQSVTKTNVIKTLQKSLEQLAKETIANDKSGMSIALLVMDHQTGKLLASVGSADYFDQERQGFVDMTNAIRSPGSVLKPIIYGLAFDQGLVHPETLIDDRPTTYGNYSPQNFDKRFRGTLRVRESLQQSLNIPTVSLLQAIGPAQLIARITGAGVNPVLPGSQLPGLAIGLGGIGLTLNELVSLYAAIANGGSPLNKDKNNPLLSRATNTSLMSASAAWHIGDILSGVVEPIHSAKNQLAYKTGTSYGHRDGWALGFDGKHVVGVWTGRPDGASLPGMLGSSVAAPILFDAFSRLKTKLTPLPPPPLGTVLVDNANLPQPLKRFRGRNAVFGLPVNSPIITFPPDGTRVDLGYSGNMQQPLVLKVRNGRPPFTWIADGLPVLIAVHDRQTSFTPDGPGYLNLAVIDSDGLSQNIRIAVD